MYGKRVWEIPHKGKKTKFNKRKKIAEYCKLNHTLLNGRGKAKIIEQNLAVEWKNPEGYQRQWSRDQRRKQI